jgi:DNA helicase IV
VAIRASGHEPFRRRVSEDDLSGQVARLAAEELALLEEGRLAVIAPAELTESLAGELAVVLGDRFDPSNPLSARVALITVADAKGLEFDGVVLVEPGRIAARGPRGLNDLYVALTRATQRLSVIHSAEVPAELREHLVEG